jgi:hypothetical protein
MPRDLNDLKKTAIAAAKAQGMAPFAKEQWLFPSPNTIALGGDFLCFLSRSRISYRGDIHLPIKQHHG